MPEVIPDLIRGALDDRTSDATSCSQIESGDEQLMNVIELEQAAHLPAYAKLPLVIERGDGCWVYTAEGERYLDLYGGHAVASTGHCHPRLVARLKAQAEALIFYSNVVYNSSRARAAARLCEVAPAGFTSVFFVNSGAEANENALKLARQVTGRAEIISFEGAFHGRTWVTYQASQKKVDGGWRSGPLSPLEQPEGSRAGADATASKQAITGSGRWAKTTNAPSPLDDHPIFRILPFGDVDAVQQAITTRTAAVILEPIQSLAGVRMAPPDFYQALRRACDDTGAVLIYDEVQTGCGRTGSFFFAPRFDVTPDIITLAKGIASGVPMGAVLVREPIARHVKIGDLGSTFGGGPLACAALDETLAIIEEEDLLDNVRQTSAYLMTRLAGLPLVAEIRGLGFLIGLRLTVPARDIQQRLLRHKIITGLSDDEYVLRLLPPLTLTRSEADFFVEVFRDICYEQ